MSHDDDTRKVAELIKDIRVAMLTHTDSTGRLVSHPMATQEVEFDGDVLFIAERDSHKCQDIAAQSPARVNVSYSSGSSWVSLSGTARSSTTAPSSRSCGTPSPTRGWRAVPENPNNVLIKVSADSAEFWDTPGSKATQVLNLVKAKVTGERLDDGDLVDNEVVDL